MNTLKNVSSKGLAIKVRFPNGKIGNVVYNHRKDMLVTVMPENWD